MKQVWSAIGACTLAVASFTAAAQPPGAATIRPLLWQPGMARSEVGEINVFRRFSSERTDRVTEFYGYVLGLTALPASAPGGGQMIRYPVGNSEVKLFPSPPNPMNTAPLGDVIGVRLLTFFYDDEEALVTRFRSRGFATPVFEGPARGERSALVQDPDGEWVELVIAPGVLAEDLKRFEIGVVVADVERSAAFYRDIVGLEEMPPVEDSVLGATKHPFRHGTTTINLYAFRADSPKDVETAGVQYIVWNVAAVDALARARGARIDRPLSEPGQMRTIWLQDPDGVSNYFAQFAGNDNRPASR